MGFYLPSVDPVYDPVRPHPRFKAVMKRANLPHELQTSNDRPDQTGVSSLTSYWR